MLGYLTQSQEWGPEVLAGIDDLVDEVTNSNSVLMISTLVRTEVFFGDLNYDQKLKFADVFRRPNIQEYDVSPRVSDRASSIREFYAHRALKIKTPDAIHLATAIIHQADVFYTLDGAGKRRRPTDLLSLDGNVAGYGLSIKKPPLPSVRPRDSSLLIGSLDHLPLLKAAYEPTTQDASEHKKGEEIGNPHELQGTKQEQGETSSFAASAGLRGSGDRHLEGEAGTEDEERQEK